MAEEQTDVERGGKRRGARIQLTGELIVTGIDAGAADLYGLDPRRVVGRHLAQVLLGDAGPLPWAAFWERVRTGRDWAQTMAHRSCAGVRVWVEARLREEEGGAVLCCQPSSGFRVMGIDPGAFWAPLAEGLAAGGVGLYLDDGITDEQLWSERACELWGVGRGGAPSHAALFEAVHPDDAARFARDIQRTVVEHCPLLGEYRFKDTRGDYRDLRVFGVAGCDDHGAMMIGVGGVLDISRERRLARRVAELEDQLHAAQRSDMVGRLVAGIAHDFNNLLSIVLSSAEFISRGALSSEQRRDVGYIQSAALRATEMTRQVVAFGRRQATLPRAIEPDAVLQSAVALLRRMVPEETRIHLQAACATATVRADETQLHQVICNLVLNSAQAMRRGGDVWILSRVGQEPAGPAGDAAPFVQWIVRDSGPGIDESVRGRIFEPFFTTKARRGGSGLGLSVVKEIVERHGGHVRVECPEAGGAQFQVSLPAVEEEAAPALRARPSEVRVRYPGTVLLVEDEAMVRELTRRILEGDGLDVLLCGDAEQALEVARSASFDLLLTDVVLPSLGGRELAAKLRSVQRELHVLYLSGYPRDFVEERIALGPRDVLITKPCEPDRLLRAVHAQLGQIRTRAAAG